MRHTRPAPPTALFVAPLPDDAEFEQHRQGERDRRQQDADAEHRGGEQQGGLFLHRELTEPADEKAGDAEAERGQQQPRERTPVDLHTRRFPRNGKNVHVIQLPTHPPVSLGSTRELRWLAADLYEEFEQQFADDRQGRIALYIHDGDLSLLNRYREPVASVAPVEYFERYRELLVPFAAGETGRRHYREIADHLEEMQGLVPEERFAEFVGFLKDEHSNRPAFLDELEKAGF